jgi:hypothetical protein
MPMMIMGAMVAIGGVIVPFAARLRPKSVAALQEA